MSVKDIQGLIREEYGNLADQNKEDVRLRIQEQKAHRAVFAQAAKEDARARLQERMNRWKGERENRMQEYQNKMEEMRSRYVHGDEE